MATKVMKLGNGKFRISGKLSKPKKQAIPQTVKPDSDSTRTPTPKKRMLSNNY